MCSCPWSAAARRGFRRGGRRQDGAAHGDDPQHDRPSEGSEHVLRIGERCREGEELYREMKEAGVLPNMVMVFGQMNEPPGSRFRVGHAALTMAEYFRDDEHRDVLLLIDNIFRFIQAGTEVSGLMGQMPSRLGYQPTMGTELSRTGGADRQHRYRRHHVHPGGICAGGRFHRSGGGAYVLASLGVDSALAQAGQRRPLSGHRPTAIRFQDGHAWHRRRTALSAWRRRSGRRSRVMRSSRTSSPYCAGADKKIVIEVLAQRDAHCVRGIALTPTQGLARGMAVEDTAGR